MPFARNTAFSRESPLSVKQAKTQRLLTDGAFALMTAALRSAAACRRTELKLLLILHPVDKKSRSEPLKRSDVFSAPPAELSMGRRGEGGRGGRRGTPSGDV